MASVLQFLPIWLIFFQWHGELSVRIHFRAVVGQGLTGRGGKSQQILIVFRLNWFSFSGGRPFALLNMNV